MTSFRSLCVLGLGVGRVEAEPPTFGGAALDSSKGFHDKSHIPRESMVFEYADGHACMHPIQPFLHHIDTMDDCEHSCFFESKCRYIAYDSNSKDCFMYESCDEKDLTSSSTFTVLHKKDPGVLATLEVSSGCTLAPDFSPMVTNYIGECSGIATASATFNSRNDILVNGVQYFPADFENEALVPVELYHDTPSVLTITTLRDLEHVDVPQKCEHQAECKSNHWAKHNRCVVGLCRVATRIYTVAMTDTSVGNGDHASTNPEDGARSRQTILIKPPDANDNIAVYAQVVQPYAGIDYEKDAMEMVHNNKPLQIVCQHCNAICSRGENDKWFMGHHQGLDRQACMSKCYHSRECVAANYNKHDMVCDLFRTCHEKDMVVIADAVIGAIAKLEADPMEKAKKGEAESQAQKRRLGDKEPAAPEPPKLLLKEDIEKIKKEAEAAKMQKIKNDETGETEILAVPKEFQRPAGAMSDYVVFRRPELNAPKYHAPDKHLLDFGGTEYGTIDMIGQSGTQDCILNAHAGGGTSDPNTKFSRSMCTKKADNVVLYVTGRGITPANFRCKDPMCESAKDFNCTDTTTIMINPMESVDRLGTMRDTIELSTQFTKVRNVMFTCSSWDLDKTIEHKIAFSLEFADHNDFAKVLEENMAEFNNPDLNEYNVGFPPKCRNAHLRGVFSDQSRCEQVPAVWNPLKHHKVRYICPLEEDSDIEINAVVEDASAKVEFNGDILRNMKHITSSDGKHGGSPYGGVDFYYPLQNVLSIKKDTEYNVKSWKLDTFCEEGGASYDIIMQNGWNMEPELLDIKISTGNNCKLKPDKIKKGVTNYEVLCPGDTKWIGITPLVKDIGTRMIVNTEEMDAGSEIPPVRLEAGDEHVWDITFRPPIDPETKQVVFGYNATDVVHIQVVGVRFAPFGLGDTATKIIASICSFFGIGLAIISSANFVGVAKFLQFLGILVAIHGVPDAFRTFCESFSKINFDLKGIDDYLPDVKKYMPFNLEKFQKMAAEAAGLPFRALKILQEHAAVTAIQLHRTIMQHGDTANDENASMSEKELAAAAKKKAEEVAAIRRKYRKQFLAFKEHLHKMKESFQKEKGLLFNMFMLPMILSALGIFYMIRYFLRIFIPAGCYGYDWDQARVEQAKPNYIFLFICDLGMIGFVKASSKIYCEGTEIELYLPDGNGKWGMQKPAKESMEALCLFLFFAYPVVFLFFTFTELAKNQRTIVYNKALGGYADKEGCQEIRATQKQPIPIPGIGPILAKVNLAFSKNVKGVSPILWAKNLKSEVIFDKTRKTHWLMGLGVMLEGRVQGSKLPANDDQKTDQETLDYVYQWAQIKVGKVENKQFSPFKEGDLFTKFGRPGDYEVDEFGMEKIGANGKRIVRMREILRMSMSEIERECYQEPWVEVMRKGQVKIFRLPRPIEFGMFDVCTSKFTSLFKKKKGAPSGMDALAAMEAEELTKTSAQKFKFFHVSTDQAKKEELRSVDRDFEVRVFVGANGGKPFTFQSKTIPVTDGKGKIKPDPLKRYDRTGKDLVAFNQKGNISHTTESISWERQGGQRTEGIPYEMSAEWKDDEKVGCYHYSINTKGEDMRSDIIMDFTMCKEKVVEAEYDPELALKVAKQGCCDPDPMAELEKANAGKPAPQTKEKTRFCQRIYTEPVKYKPASIANKAGMGSRQVLDGMKQSETDWKDVRNIENPWIRNNAFKGHYARRVLQLKVPDKLKVEDSEGQMVSEPFNHVAKMEMRAAGQCSAGESEVFLVLRSPSRSLKLEFRFMAGTDVDKDDFLTLLKNLKENPTPGQQAMERCVTAAVNDYWETTKDRGGQLITDEFISIDKWKINFGGLRVKPHLKVTVDVDLEREGFTESDPVAGEKTYNACTEELLASIEKMFANGGQGAGTEGFMKRYLKELNELMKFNVDGKEIPMHDPKIPRSEAGDKDFQTRLLEKGLNIDCTKDNGGVYLDAVKVIESIGVLQSKTTQLKFEDDFDHPCLNQALNRDTLEVWITGPCYDGLTASLRIAAATLVCEKDPPKGKEKFVSIKLHSNVFCGREQMDVERSDVLNKQLEFLSDTHGNWNNNVLAVADNQQFEKKEAEMAGAKGKGGYQSVATNDDMDFSASPKAMAIAKVEQEPEVPAKGKSEIMEKVQLHPGLSPDGIPYRLSDAFENYPNAEVGRKRFNVSVLGDFRYELAGKIQNKHMPILHWFTPDYEMEVPQGNLVFPRRDFYSHYYSQMKNNQRWNFLFSRILILVSILAVIYMGKAKAAVSAESASLSHLSEHEKKNHIAHMKKQAEIESGFQQLVALFFGTFLIFGSFAWPEIQEAYKEKEEERLEELKDQNAKEPEGFIAALTAQINWYMGSAEHRYFAFQAIYDGGSFSYASQLLLVFFLIMGHEGSPWTYKIPLSLISWVLILITGFTLVRLNLAFLKEKWKSIKKQVSEIDDRIVAEYEAKMKMYQEKKAQVLGFPDKIKGEYEAKKKQVEDAHAKVLEVYRQYKMSEAAKQKEEEDRINKEKELLEEKRKAGIAEEQLSDSDAESPVNKGRGGSVGKGAPLLANDREMKPLREKYDVKAVRESVHVYNKKAGLKDDEVVGEPSSANVVYTKHYGMGMGEGARAIQKQTKEELANWNDYTLPPAVHIPEDPDAPKALTWLEQEEIKREEERKKRPGVIKGNVALTEIQAVTGLSQTYTWLQHSRDDFRKTANLLYDWVFGPCVRRMNKQKVSNFVKFICAPAFFVFWFYIFTFYFSPGFFFWLFWLAVGGKLARNIYKYGVLMMVESEESKEKRKQEEKNKRLKQKEEETRAMIAQMKADGIDVDEAMGRKILSIHEKKVCETNVDAKEHVKSALQACELVSSNWSKGEHQFNKMPAAMQLVQRKPIPDINKGFFELEHAHFDQANPPVFKDIGNNLAGSSLFTVRDYVFDYCDIIVDTLGLRIPAEMRPVRHDKTLSKKLLQVNKPLGTTRDLVKSFPIQVSEDFFAGGKKNKLFDDEEDEGETVDTSNVVTQVVATLHVVNFIGKGEVDRPENDSYLTLTQTKKVGGKKGGAAIDLKRFKEGDDIILFDLKKGDLWPIEVDDNDDERLKFPKLANDLAVKKAQGRKENLKDSDIDFEFVPEEGENGADAQQATKASDAYAIGQCSWMRRPDDNKYSNVTAVLEQKVEFHQNGPKKGEPFTDKEVYFKIRTSLEGEDEKLWQIHPVQAGTGEMLLKKDGDLSLEQQKAKQCAEWFMQAEEWYDFLGASVNLRANLHKCFDALFWGVDTDIKGGRPKDKDGARKKFMDKETKELPDQQKGILARVLDRKDEGMTSKEYFDYLMYGDKQDKEWPGFIHWFRAKAKAGKTVRQLNANPDFHEGQVPEPGAIVETLSKPVLSPAVLHVVLTDTDLRAPGDVVEDWQPQRAEPHNVEMFMLDKNHYAEGQLGLLKLFPDKLQFEAPSGDDQFGDLGAMSDVVNFDFSDTYAMHAIVEDTFKKDKKTGDEVLAVTGRTLYLQMKSGSVVAFGMSEDKIKMWQDLIHKFSMNIPQQILLGYDGELTEHPLDPNVQIRSGKQGIQKWYAHSNKRNGYVARAKYSGSWENHKYDGDGLYFKYQVCKEPHHWVSDFKFQDTFHPEDKAHKAHTHAMFEREVLIYDGGFKNGLRQGKGIMFFKTVVDGAPLLYRFSGLFVDNRPVLGELMHVDQLPKDGVPYIKYYLGTMEALGKAARKEAKEKGRKQPQLMKSTCLDVSPWELYAACCLSLGTNNATPAQVLAKMKSDFGAYVVDPAKPLRKILKLLPRLNEMINTTKRTQGYKDEDLSEFDLYMLSRALEPLKKLPLVSQLMEPDDPKGGSRNGEKVDHYKFVQRVNPKEYTVSEYIQEDVEQLYNNWFKYDCVNDMSKEQGTTYAVDGDKRTAWQTFHQSLDSMIEDWKAYKKEIPYEDACSLLDIALKKKPKEYKRDENGDWKPMRAAEAKESVLEKLRQCLPHKDDAPSWYEHVSGDVYAEDHWESKEVFRSLHRKFCALNPTHKSFYEDLKAAIPKDSPSNDIVPGKKGQTYFEDGTDLEFQTSFLKYMGRSLQVNGKISRDGKSIESWDENQLGMFDHEKCNFLNQQMNNQLKDEYALNGFLKMRSSQGIDFAASIVNGQAHGPRASISSHKFSYEGDYLDGKFHGKGELNVHHEDHYEKFQGLRNYKGEWVQGKKHGNAVFEHVNSFGDIAKVTAKYDMGKIKALDKVKVSAADPKNNWTLIEEDKEMAFEFELDGSEVVYKVPRKDNAKIHNGDRYTIDGAKIELRGADALYRGPIKDQKFHGEGCILRGKSGEYVGNFKDGRRHGKGVWTFGREGSTFGPEGTDYKGTTVTAEFRGDKPVGPVNVSFMKDGKKAGEFKNIMIMPAGNGDTKIVQGGCVPGGKNFPTEMLTDKFPKTQGLPYAIVPEGQKPGFPLEFNSKEERQDYKVEAPWGGEVKF